MFSFDFSDPDRVRIFYTSEDYVPAAQEASTCGIATDRWWVDDPCTYEGRNVYTVITREWTSEQRQTLQDARRFSEYFQRQNRRRPTLEDRPWLDERWLIERSESVQIYNSNLEKLQALAFRMFLEHHDGQERSVVAVTDKVSEAPLVLSNDPALDTARASLLTVLRMGSWGGRTRLLMQLRERNGANVIFSYHEGRFVPLGYWG